MQVITLKRKLQKEKENDALRKDFSETFNASYVSALECESVNDIKYH
jgi:hypothetical protein